MQLRPNGPELSCGGEQPPQGSSLRGRSSQMILVRPTPRGEIITAGSVSLSDWLGRDFIFENTHYSVVVFILFQELPTEFFIPISTDH